MMTIQQYSQRCGISLENLIKQAIQEHGSLETWARLARVSSESITIALNERSNTWMAVEQPVSFPAELQIIKFSSSESFTQDEEPHAYATQEPENDEPSDSCGEGSDK